MGQLGNQDVPLYSYYPAVNLNTPYYLGDAPGPQALGGAITDLVNEKLTWETTTVTNIGLDATFFDGRFNFTAEVYKRLTDDILLRLPIPAMVGRGAPFQNAGAVENKEWEVNIGWQDVINDFSYRIDFNLSDNINKVVDLAGTGPYILGGNLDRRIVEVGTAINSWYGWEAIGGRGGAFGGGAGRARGGVVGGELGQFVGVAVLGGRPLELRFGRGLGHGCFPVFGSGFARSSVNGRRSPRRSRRGVRRR